MKKVCNYCGDKRRRYIWGLCFDCYDDFSKETGYVPPYRKPSYFSKRNQRHVLKEAKDKGDVLYVIDNFNDEIAFIGYSTKY